MIDLAYLAKPDLIEWNYQIEQLKKNHKDLD